MRRRVTCARSTHPPARLIKHASTAQGLDGAIAAKTVTYDFHRMMEGATKLKCSEFGAAIIKHF